MTDYLTNGTEGGSFGVYRAVLGVACVQTAGRSKTEVSAALLVRIPCLPALSRRSSRGEGYTITWMKDKTRRH